MNIFYISIKIKTKIRFVHKKNLCVSIKIKIKIQRFFNKIWIFKYKKNNNNIHIKQKKNIYIYKYKLRNLKNLIMQNVVQRIFDKWCENLPFTLNMVWTPVPVILLFNTAQSFSQKGKKMNRKKE